MLEGITLFPLESTEDLKVSGSTDTQKLANAIITSFRNGHNQRISCIGAATVNTGAKAIATASNELSKGPTGIERIYAFVEWFDTNGSDGQNVISGVRFTTYFAKR